MSSVPMPRAARGAVALAFLIALVSGLSVRSGPIMLLGVCFAALVSAFGILKCRVWSAYGFAGLLILGILAILFFAVTGQNAGTLLQSLIGVVLYAGIAVIFLLAGHSLATAGARRGSPIPWILIAILFAAPFVFFRPVSVSSVDMENTLLVGDFLLVDRFSGIHPAFGKMVAFHYPLNANQLLVRRVIGLPGDRLHFVSGALFRNGAAVIEPYVTHNNPSNPLDMPSYPNDVPANDLNVGGRDVLAHNIADGNVIVPAGKYFVLGDARDQSRDSRIWGFVDRGEIMGQPKFIYDSLAPDPADIKPASPKSGDEDYVEPGHPPVRRWDRVFRPL